MAKNKNKRSVNASGDDIIEEDEELESEGENPIGEQARADANVFEQERAARQAAEAELAQARAELEEMRAKAAAANESKASKSKEEAAAKSEEGSKSLVVDMRGVVATYKGMHYGPGLCNAPKSDGDKGVAALISARDRREEEIESTNRRIKEEMTAIVAPVDVNVSTRFGSSAVPPAV